MKKKLKIIICSQEHPPIGSGIAFVVYNIAQELKNKNHDVKVISPVGPDIKLGNIKLIEKTGGIGLLLFWNDVAKYINQNGHKYDIIWTHNPLFLKKISAKNVINTTHTTYRERVKTLKGIYTPVKLRIYNRIMKFFEKKAYKKMKLFKFTVTSDLTKKELFQLGIQKKFPKISNGVNLKIFNNKVSKEKIRLKLGIPLNIKILIYIARMMPQKNHLQLLNIFSKIEKKNKNIKLILVGDGPLLKKVKEIIKKKRIKNVILKGKINQKKLALYCKCSDFFISPSSYEGQPLSLLESLACGLIPIISKIPIFNHMINELNAGILTDFTNKNTKKIYEYIENINIPKTSKKIANFIEKNYSWSTIADEYLEEFYKLNKK